MLFAIFLVLIGILWLLSNLGVITTTVSQVIWPLIVIAIGLYLLLKRKKAPHLKPWFFTWEEGDKKEEKE
jgi:uncharacterized membrane protein